MWWKFTTLHFAAYAHDPNHYLILKLIIKINNMQIFHLATIPSADVLRLTLPFLICEMNPEGVCFFVNTIAMWLLHLMQRNTRQCWQKCRTRLVFAAAWTSLCFCLVCFVCMVWSASVNPCPYNTVQPDHSQCPWTQDAVFICPPQELLTDDLHALWTHTGNKYFSFLSFIASV